VGGGDTATNKTSGARFKRIIPIALIGFMPLVMIGLVLILVYANHPTPESVTFRNPLNQSHGSDPWMVYYEGKYYLAATTWSPSSRPGLTMKSASTIQDLIDASPVSVYTDTDTSRCCNFSGARVPFIGWS
jgi:hypothetical protein